MPQDGAIDQVFEWPTGKKLIVYHTNWATYGRNFQIKDLPIQYISDINYAFFDLRPSPNPPHHLIPTSTDPWADTDKRYTNPDEGVPPPDSWNETPENKGPWGNFGQLLKLKKLGLKFNVGLSVGGWTLSKGFSDAVKGEREREAFVEGILECFERWPGVFNRVDIDWEYISPPNQNYGAPGNIVRAEDPQNFGAFLRLLRHRLNATGRSHFEISACVTGDPAKMDVLPLREMVEYLDTINVMTYDFASSAWGPCPAGHQTNLISTPYAPLSVSRTVEAYLSRGVPPHKLVIGAAAYSRGFANTTGLGAPSSGVVEDRSWEDGVCDYKTLPRPGAVEYWDDRDLVSLYKSPLTIIINFKAQASYSYDPHRRILNSYDTPQSIRAKCRYVWERGLKGVIVWESSGDVPVTNERSLMRALWEGLARDPR
ncbi:hypothetical protein SpCBS45565_g02771 [Spizellomyces sp. 'palustris']|nr:hypothetical protein SpCBS45565_g02771 [Spizellomyces sp. 'palustris']